MISLNGKKITPTIFPDKTSQVWKIQIPTEIRALPMVVIWDFEHEGEIMHLFQLKELLDTYGVQVSLYMPYLPYARQDKDIKNESTFAAHTFAKIINHMHFYSVTAYDPHSKQGTHWLWPFQAVSPEQEIRKTIDEVNPDALCYPDKGAANKYWEYLHDFHPRTLICDKTRDPSTGEIKGLEIINGTPKNKKVLIVDDICDGGATFIGLALLLADKGAKEIYLHVSHGIFSKGTKPLFDAGISRIFTCKGEVRDTSNSHA